MHLFNQHSLLLQPLATPLLAHLQLLLLLDVRQHQQRVARMSPLLLPLLPIPLLARLAAQKPWVLVVLPTWVVLEVLMVAGVPSVLLLLLLLIHWCLAAASMWLPWAWLVSSHRSWRNSSRSDNEC